MHATATHDSSPFQLASHQFWSRADPYSYRIPGRGALRPSHLFSTQEGIASLATCYCPSIPSAASIARQNLESESSVTEKKFITQRIQISSHESTHIRSHQPYRPSLSPPSAHTRRGLHRPHLCARTSYLNRTYAVNFLRFYNLGLITLAEPAAVKGTRFRSDSVLT